MNARRVPGAVRRLVSRGADRAVAAAITASLLCHAPVPTLAQAASPPPAVTARPPLVVRVDSGPVTVGDRVTLHFRVRLPAGARLADPLPVSREPLPDGIQLLHVDSLRSSGDGDATGTATVVFFRPGAMRVPPMAATYRGAPNAPSDSVVSDAVAVTVTPVVAVGSGSLRDIKDIEAAPISMRAAATAAAIGVAALMLVLASARFHQRRRAASIAAGAGLALRGTSAGAYDTALAGLAAIAADWAGRGDVDSHYAHTADVLRRYLAEARGIPALERTTPEVVGALRQSAPDTHVTTRDLLDAADLVKFAWYTPPPPAPTMLLATARALLAAWDAVDPVVAAAPEGGDPVAPPSIDRGDAGTRDRHAIR